MFDTPPNDDRRRLGLQRNLSRLVQFLARLGKDVDAIECGEREPDTSVILRLDCFHEAWEALQEQRKEQGP